MINEEALIDFLLEPLREFVKDKPDWEWGMIGDCWLESWNIARRIERLHGINHQIVLRFIVREIMPLSAIIMRNRPGPLHSKVVDPKAEDARKKEVAMSLPEVLIVITELNHNIYFQWISPEDQERYGDMLFIGKANPDYDEIDFLRVIKKIDIHRTTIQTRMRGLPGVFDLIWIPVLPWKSINNYINNKRLV